MSPVLTEGAMITYAPKWIGLRMGSITSFLPNKPRGIPGVDDRRVLNGIFWVLRSGTPRRDLPASYGPHHLL
jgi:transposase